ncbi:3,4-dihydroxyphenylacetate 2,3-dioxygenase [Bradyrhizobium cosmicum]|uniref:Metapyrocatechase n=1 Tax=Bradyrhizobium cosmicum TaxID=1404864 RepID=A0AAI8MDL9_9BRAD|nr:3,4-dihydroxyphenylacetate 2,3-dioxygenase [Bradyrhizobium cosmicum]BAL78238.1 putative metapyrocatechase [Bradyrhizobium cosmicum]
MPVPQHIFEPPFNIIRSSHVVLDVTDLKLSRAFYETTVGLHVEDADDKIVYLRAAEEHQHHSLVLRKAAVPACARLGFKVGNDGDLDKAAAFLSENGLSYAFVDQPFQGRTLQFTDPFGFQIELYATMDKRPHLLRRFDLYKGCHPQRLDHFNVFAAEVQDTVEFYTRLGFRLSEYAEEDGPNGRIAAAWMHRKGNVHDFAFTNGKGPRLHHFAYWTPTAMNIIHLCDVMASSGYVKNIERGPGRHGISNAFFLYVRDPDGHRLELYTSDYFTGDHDHEPLRWSLRDPRRQTLWGAPAPRSWFEQGSPFTGQTVREPKFVADVLVAD